MTFTLLAAVEVAHASTAIADRGRIRTDRAFGDPVEDALAWISQGATWLHLVDWDGAANRELLAKVIKAAHGKAAIEYVGGLRTDADVAWARHAGVDRVVLDPAADPAWLMSQFQTLKTRCSVEVPTHRGQVQAPDSFLDGLTLDEAGERLRSMKCPGALVRDLDHEGTRKGPQIPQLLACAAALAAPIVAAGVAGSLDHVRELSLEAAHGISGVVLDACLYRDYFNVAEAVAAIEARYDPYQWGPAQPWGMTGNL